MRAYLNQRLVVRWLSVVKGDALLRAFHKAKRIESTRVERGETKRNKESVLLSALVLPHNQTHIEQKVFQEKKEEALGD